VPGDPRLRHLQDFDEEAHADLVLSHQVDQSEAVAVGKRDEEFFKVEFSVDSAHNIDSISHIRLDEYIQRRYPDFRLTVESVEEEVKGAIMSLVRRGVGEAVGTALLLATVIGSGIMGDRLSGGNVAIALLANTLATGAVLVTLILTFGPISGAHFNPAVTIADASQGGLLWRAVPAYVTAQVIGAFIGVAVAHVMFGEPVFSASLRDRSGVAQLFSEFVATFGLLSVIWGCVRQRPDAVPFAVGAYITAAYWFTSSTSFANPAVTLARAASNTFAGIRPADAPGFILAQLLGAAAATALFRWLVPSLPKDAPSVLVAHPEGREQEAFKVELGSRD
jgi:glycerol uptake facilitator-like aquaporin